ncbi:MAG: ATP-dependent helicase HrpB [Alphaproteobacteria bacterium]|nr:MAG: ATP-dependent helicase HrpB [Alphaproteobacteria bacterium]
MSLDFNATGLPVAGLLPELKEKFEAANSLIVEAAPGAGKTTLIPLYLLEVGLAGSKKIVMLEPRRLAARSAARRMAALLGEEVGETVGYRVRMDSKVSARTRIEVVTEGILTRRIQSDPELADTAIVIFDEFHERSLQTDLGLALIRQVQDVLRDDLKLLVMSATLQMAALATYLDNPPVVRSEGRQFPVETRFLDRPPAGRIEATVARAVETAVSEEAGDILVFLPGAGEITRVMESLKKSPALKDALILPLYGNLSQSEQDRAITPDASGARKIVLSTDIAETSLTIEGVRIVIDAGLARNPVFDPNSGMTRLDTRRVSRASADQRRGRAGRLGPGICYRLWTQAEDRGLIEAAPPEIASADLAGLVLELAAWGARDVESLDWITPPPAGPVAQGRDLLKSLGALDPAGAITARAREMVRLPLSSRLAAMLIRAKELKAEALACDIAAILSERDILPRDRDNPNSNLKDRLLRLWSSDKSGAVAHVRRTSRDLKTRLGIKGGEGAEDVAMAGILLAFAYPDRIAEKRENSETQYRLSNGRGAALVRHDPLSGEPYLVAADLDGRGREAEIRLAAAISHDEIEQYFEAELIWQRRVFWDEKKGRVIGLKERKLGALVLESERIAKPDAAAVAAALLDLVRRKGLGLLEDDDARRFRERLAFAKAHMPEEDWPDFSEKALLERLEDWLAPYLPGIESHAALQKLKLRDLLRNQLSHAQITLLEREAPSSLQVPTSNNIRIDYANPEIPVLAVRLQEMFGLSSLPRLALGRVAITLHLLSPAHRPMQITDDLGRFWQTSYAEVKKEMKGRYPKHYWPDDPMQAEPTARAKPRGK